MRIRLQQCRKIRRFSWKVGPKKMRHRLCRRLKASPTAEVIFLQWVYKYQNVCELNQEADLQPEETWRDTEINSLSRLEPSFLIHPGLLGLSK